MKKAPIFLTHYALKISLWEKCLGIFLLFGIAYAGNTYGWMFVNNNEEIQIIKKELIEVKKQNTKVHEQNAILVKYALELSGIPNEKRKALFNLKIQQDSALISLLYNDIRTNQIIVKLLNTDWVFNDSTEFISLNYNKYERNL